MERADILRFGAFEIDLRAAELRKNGRRLKLQGQPFQVLVALLEECGEVVTRDDLKQKLWPADTFVDFDNGLNIAIRKLRQALSDSADKPRYIETLPRRGYRFIGSLEQAPGHLVRIPEPSLGQNRDGPAPAVSFPEQHVVSIAQGLQLHPTTQSLPQPGGLGPACRPEYRLEEKELPGSPRRVAPPLPLPKAGPATGRAWLQRTALVGLGLLLVAGVSAYIRPRWRGSSKAESLVGSGSSRSNVVSPPSTRPLVAIMGFRNLSGRAESGWLSTALSEMLSAELVAGERLLTVPGENVARARVDLSLPDADGYAPDTLSRIRKRLGVDYVVVGSYLTSQQDSDGRVRVDLRLQDARTGATAATVSEAGSEGDLPDLASRVGATLREKLGVGALTTEQASGVRAELPSRTEASRLYAEGLARLRLFDARGARDLLERAVASDPDYALGHAALASAWSALGYGELARQEAKKAFELSAGLPRADRLSIEAGYRETTAEWAQAVEIYRTLFAFFPDNLDYGLRLAHAQVTAGKSKGALATVEALRRLPAPVREDPALDLMESLAAEQLGDLKRARTAAATAAEGARARGAELLIAEARSRLCVNLPLLGQPDEAEAACESAREIYSRAGDRNGVASATGYLASVLTNRGETAAAKRMYKQALDVERAIGNQGGAVWALNGLANVLWLQGDLEGSTRTFEEALRVAREIGSRPDAADATDNIAFTLLLRGDLAQARKMFEQALADYRAMSNRSGVGNVLNNLGETLYFQGDLSGAAKVLDEALATDRETGNKPESADVLAWSGRVRMDQGSLEEARQKYHEAMAVWDEIGNKSYSARYALRLAELDIEAGRAAQAEAPIRKGLEVCKRQSHGEAELEARSLLARALLEEGKAEEAQREIDQAAPLADKAQSRAARLEFSLVVAQVRAAAGKASDLAEAEKSLQSALAEAQKNGFLGYQLRARLALAAIQFKAGHTPGSAVLAALQKEAEAKGFGLIARKAAATAGGRV